MSLPEAALSTKNKFSFRNSVSGESHARARRKAVRLSPNQQEHRGQMLKRNLMAQVRLRFKVNVPSNCAFPCV
jgi:hypothetical protein